MFDQYMIYRRKLASTQVLIESRYGLSWTWLKHSNFTRHNYSLISIICSIISKIQSAVKAIYSQIIFFIIAYLTLTFDLMTLTLGQLFCLININLICKYHKDPIIRLWFIGQKHLLRMDIHTHPHTYIHTHTGTDRQTDRHTDRQTTRYFPTRTIPIHSVNEWM